MNLRALTKGDAAVAGAAVLLLISSFLPYFSIDNCRANPYFACSSSAWSSDLFPVLPSVYLLGVIAAVLILLQRFQGEAAKTRQILGLRLDQWGVSFSVVALWTALWSLARGSNHSIGAYLGLLATLLLAGAAAAGPLLPVLQTPLLTDKPAAAAPLGYPGAAGGYPGAPQGQGFQQPGYGYPGAPGAGQMPGAGQSFGGQGFGGQPQQGGYGYPTPGADLPQDGGFGQQAQESPFAQAANPAQESPFAQAAAPAPEPAAAVPAPAHAADFAPFWFAVPVPRQLTPVDGSAGPTVGELLPGTWYLAVDQRGAALVAQLQDGSQGVLNDTSGIQRG